MWGMQGHFEPMLWRVGEPLQTKLNRINAVIDDLLQQGNVVSLVAVSAGASAALTIFAARKQELAGLVLISGKVHNAHRMHPSVIQKNNAFGEALDGLPAVVETLTAKDRRRIMSIHPMADESVPVADTRIPGAVERSIPVMGHFFAIAYGITIYMPIVVHFLRHQAKEQIKN